MAPKKERGYRPSKESLGAYDQFLATATLDRFQKLLVRYELLKMAAGIPGDIVECGVFKGSGIYTLAKLHKLLFPHNNRKIIGFDFFETQRKTDLKIKQDKKVLDAHLKNWSSREAILKNLSDLQINNVELIAGDVTKTTKEYPGKNLGFRIALLYLDVDNYEGTLAILKNFYPLVSPGGLVVFDEYALRGYGESDAVHEFFRGKKIKMHTFPWANTPSAYLIKEEA